MQKVKADIVIDKCTFVSFKTAIRVSNKCSFIISNNTFIDCKVALNGICECFIKSKNNIVDNVSLGRSEQMFIKGTNFNNEVHEAVDIARNLKIVNNNGRIAFFKNNDVIIDTASYFARDNDTLLTALEEVVHGGTIYLNKSRYNGGIEIHKSIEIIGEEDTIIEPTKKESNSSAFFIKANDVIISNVAIYASHEICFRDGITYTEDGGSGCKFINMRISSVRRRGISVWGKNTDNTTISNCIFEDMLNGSAISNFKRVLIDGCSFENCSTALLVMFKSNVSVTNSEFNKVNYVITANKKYLNKIRLIENKYSWTNMLINLL